MYVNDHNGKVELAKRFQKDEDEDEWRSCYMKYLSNQTLLMDRKKKEKVL